MTIDGAGVAPLSAPEPQHKTSFQRIAGALFAPSATFEDIARKPDVLVPLLVLVIISYASIALTMPRIDFDAMLTAQAEQFRAQGRNLSDEDVERMGRFTTAITKVMGWIGPLLMVAWYAVVAGIILLVVRMFGGEGSYKQAFSATVYSWFPLLIFSIVSTIVIVSRGSFDPMTAATMVKSNPAFLVDMKEQPVLFSLLSSLDVFTIWTIVLLVIGFAALSKSSRVRSAVIVVSLWLVMILIKIGFAAMGAARMKA